MKGLFLAIAAAALPACVPIPSSRSHVEECSTFLSQKWPEKVFAHQLDPAKHVVLVSIDIPVQAPQKEYERAISALQQAFPSFTADPASGILLGCCAIPVLGSVSFDDLTRLSSMQFVPLCDVGHRFRSNGVGPRAEHRGTYERHQHTDAHFFVYWRRNGVR